MNGEKKDYKVVIIGDSHVGKTTLLKKFVGKTDLGREAYVQKSIERIGRNINLQIHDTMGQERFRSLTTSYYRGSDGCLVCFDVMNQSTFDALKTWFTDLKGCSENKRISVLLVGLNRKNFPTQEQSADDTKRHLYPSQKVEQSKIDLFREEHKQHSYVEVDLTSQTDVTNCFETLVDIMIEDIMNSRQQNDINPNMVHVGQTNTDTENMYEKSRCSC